MVRWTRFVISHRKRFLAAWVICVVVAGAASAGLGNLLSNRFSLPGAEAETGFNILKDKFGQQGTPTRRFEAQLRWCPVPMVRDITPGRGIPAGCVAPLSNTPGILGRRALPSGCRAPGFMPRSTGTGH